MHPVIRIASFIVLSTALAFGGWPQLLIGAALVAVLLALSGMATARTAAALLLRLRWLWLSLAIVYFWYTPGEPLLAVDGLHAWLPTREGVALGMQRIGALAAMALAAGLLSQLTSREQLIAALYWLAAPLAVAGIARERVAVRVALGLAALGEVRAEVQATVRPPDAPRMPWRRWGDVAAALLRTVMLRAETAPCIELRLPPRSAPPAWQWLWPLLLAVVMLAAAAWPT